MEKQNNQSTKVEYTHVYCNRGDITDQNSTNGVKKIDRKKKSTKVEMYMVWNHRKGSLADVNSNHYWAEGGW